MNTGLTLIFRFILSSIRLKVRKIILLLFCIAKTPLFDNGFLKKSKQTSLYKDIKSFKKCFRFLMFRRQIDDVNLLYYNLMLSENELLPCLINITAILYIYYIDAMMALQCPLVSLLIRYLKKKRKKRILLQNVNTFSYTIIHFNHITLMRYIHSSKI